MKSSGMFNHIGKHPPISRGNQSGRKLPVSNKLETKSDEGSVHKCPVCGQECDTAAEVKEHLRERGNSPIKTGDSVRCVNYPKLAGRITDIDRDHSHMTIGVRLSDGKIQQRRFAVWIVDQRNGARNCVWEKVEENAELAPASSRARRETAPASSRSSRRTAATL